MIALKKQKTIAPLPLFAQKIQIGFTIRADHNPKPNVIKKLLHHSIKELKEIIQNHIIQIVLLM